MPQQLERDATRRPEIHRHSIRSLYHSELLDMASELHSVLEKTRSLSLDVLKLTYQESIPSELALPSSFWKCYGDEKLAIGLRACLATCYLDCLWKKDCP